MARGWPGNFIVSEAADFQAPPAAPFQTHAKARYYHFFLPCTSRVPNCGAT